jgi:outer membrane protein insertion porin family
MDTFPRYQATRIVMGYVIFLICTMAALAQQNPPAAAASLSYEGQKVASVELAGRPEINLRVMNALIAQPINAPYRQTQVEATVAALKERGHFQDVTVQVMPEANGLRVLFVLQPALYFGVFNFSRTASVFPYTRLLQAANYPRQEPYTAGRVEEAESNLLDFFHQTGYFRATVEPELQTDSARGIVNVLFLIRPGRRSKFGEISIDGLDAAQTRRMQHSLRSLRARLRAAYIKPGKTYSLKRLQNAIKFLQARLGSQHYLAARIQLISSKYNAQTNRADVRFHITQGPRINIQVAGAHIWGRTQKKLIPIYQENTVDQDLVLEGQQNLISYFESKGFFDVKVQSRVTNEASGESIRYQIEKGKRGKVAGIDFHGNQQFSDKDLKSHIAVKKAKRFIPFSHGSFSELLMRRSVKNLEALYRNAGYSDAKVIPKVINHSGKLQVTFSVQEGERDFVESLQVEGNRSLSESQLAPKGLNLEPGKPYSQQLLSKDRDEILATYLDRGFLTAAFRARVTQDKKNPHRVTVVYSIDEGPQVFTRGVDPVGAPHTRPEIIATNANIKTGKPLSQTALLAGESRLYTLGVFDWASVDTAQPITEQSQAQVLVKLHEAKRNTITYGFGFEATKRGGSVPGGTVAVPGLPPVGLPKNFKTSESTFWGPRGSIEYTRRNFRGRAETVTGGIFAGRLYQRATAGWNNPNFWNSIWTSTLSLSADRSSQNPLFTERLGQAGVEFQRYLDAKKTKSVFVRYSFSRTTLSNLLSPDLVLPEDRNVRLSTISGSYSRDTRDNPLDAHLGFYQSFQIDLNPSALGSNTNFGRFLGQVAYYKSFASGATVWANSVRLGLEQAFAGAHIPVSESFFSGGGSTIRGFPLNGAGPQRPVLVCGNPADVSTCAQITVPVGGPQLFIVNSELRFPSSLFSKLGGVAFYDGGNIFRSLGLGDIGSYSNTIGVGLRYATPVGPVRFDVGHNLNPVAGISSWQYFITLGQAF